MEMPYDIKTLEEKIEIVGIAGLTLKEELAYKWYQSMPKKEIKDDRRELYTVK
jgi:hypothetical protein